MTLSEDEVNLLLHLAENCRDEARLELLLYNPINIAAAEIKVRQSNLIRKALSALGIPNIGPEWKIENRRVVPVF